MPRLAPTLWQILALASLAIANLPAAEPGGASKPSAGKLAPPAAAVALPRVSRTTGVDWPGFLGPTGDSKSPEKGPLAPWPDTGPPIVWTAELGEGYGPPTVSQGRLFIFDRIENRDRLRALESETGRELWTFSYPTDYQDLYGYDGGPRASPVVDGDRVYIFGPEGMLHCLRVADGGVVWKLDTAAEYHVTQNFFGAGSTPVIYKDLLIAQIGGSPADMPPAPPGQLGRVVGAGSGVVAFDKRTGAARYKLTDELASYSSPKLATIGSRDWCFVFARGGLVGFDPAAGKLDFEFPWRATILESVNASNPVVVGDRVFISETYGPGSALLAVRPGGRDVVWSDADRRRDKAMRTHWNTPIEVDGFLYGSSGRHEGEAALRCIELATGAVRWSEPRLHRTSLLHVDGHFICLGEDGTLRLLRVNPEKFELVSAAMLLDPSPEKKELGFAARRLLKAPAWAAPVLSHGLLYVRGRDRLACIELLKAR